MTSHHQTTVSTQKCAIGVDVGGTKCAAGLVGLDDRSVLVRRLWATQPERGGAAVLADVLDAAAALQDEARRLGNEAIAVGIGIAELVGLDGRLRSAATIDWRDLDVCGQIRSRMDLPALIEADVRAAARAEAACGAGRGLPSFLFVTVGTGISAALVIEGRPYRGARGLTGTFASSRVLVAADGGSLFTGPPLEQFAAGPAIAGRYNASRSDSGLQAPEVIERCEAGDAAARQVVESAGAALGAAIAQLVNMLDPAAVVLGGGLGLVEGTYRCSVEAAVREYVWSEHHRSVAVISAQLGPDAGIIGAALAAVDDSIVTY